MKRLEIFFLPTYSPELNIIEILWRFIKYQWLETNAYESYSALVKAVEDLVRNIQLILRRYLEDISILTQPEENLTLIMKNGKTYKGV